MAMKPLIGITCGWIEYEQGRPQLPDPAFDYLKSQYSERIADAGGIPVILPNIPDFTDDESALSEIVESIDGILFSGGRDMNPEIYGENEKHPKNLYMPERDARRDNFEIALARFAIYNSDIPIFGICRGHQVINIAMGGTLYQDISEFWDNGVPEKIEHRTIHDVSGATSTRGKKIRSLHEVKILDNTLLAEILGDETIPQISNLSQRSHLIVNSSHHQFVKSTGKDLKISALAQDNAIEGLEIADSSRFLLTVQWHPEAMDNEISDKLFNFFIARTFGSF
ncbi:gamma-glutamyl-gamma-aminobutyrate hydrolase family protein [bacterium]|nr:gamma-glutamyl-gamma-aminobutyrate hydrolase family protein [bacterium]